MRDSYILYKDCAYFQPTLKTVVKWGRQSALYSTRLGTGIFGDPHCAAGNRGPPGRSEVLFAVGDIGLVKLVKLGFVPCPVCKPHEQPDFWRIAGKAIVQTYVQPHFLKHREDLMSLPYDARRVDWEFLLPLTGSPGRMYVPRGLPDADVEEFRDRLRKLYAKPVIGYYDRDAPGRFVQY
ncbi:hypothetical protein HY642_02680 [Candidatus Woesearchaeota archaeon]|nr:hypothetical protein [Candidatus Woesearchaeota archaeon]